MGQSLARASSFSISTTWLKTLSLWFACLRRHNRLQRDHDQLAKWEDLWKMQIHPEKCQVLRVCKKHKPNYNGSYTLHGHSLKIVNEFKYLGVTLQGDLR